MMEKFSSWVGRNMPTREQIERNRFIPNAVLRSELWRFTRRSVPRGVALGMLVGIIVPFAQIIFASILSFTVRANVPVAALTTFVTNPFTTPFIWAISYQVGAWLLRVDSMIGGGPIASLFEVTDVSDFLRWLTAEGEVLALGLVVVAVISAAVSYLVTAVLWNAWIRRKRRRRWSAAHEGRVDQG